MLLKHFETKHGLQFIELHSDECPNDAKEEYYYIIGELTKKMMVFFGLTLDQVHDLHKRVLQEFEVALSRELMRFFNGGKPKILTTDQFKHYRLRLENELKKAREANT